MTRIFIYSRSFLHFLSHLTAPCPQTPPDIRLLTRFLSPLTGLIALPGAPGISESESMSQPPSSPSHSVARPSGLGTLEDD